jgi:hypothetical protein
MLILPCFWLNCFFENSSMIDYISSANKMKTYTYHDGSIVCLTTWPPVYWFSHWHSFAMYFYFVANLFCIILFVKDQPRVFRFDLYLRLMEMFLKLVWPGIGKRWTTRWAKSILSYDTNIPLLFCLPLRVSKRQEQDQHSVGGSQ